MCPPHLASRCISRYANIQFFWLQCWVGFDCSSRNSVQFTASVIGL